MNARPTNTSSTGNRQSGVKPACAEVAQPGVIAGAVADVARNREGLAGEIGEADDTPPGEPMPARKDDAVRLLRERLGGEPASRRVIVTVGSPDDRQVKCPRTHSIQCLVGPHLLEVDLDVWEGSTKPAHHHRHEGDAGGQEGAHPDVARPQTCDRLQVGIIDLSEDRDGVLAQVPYPPDAARLARVAGERGITMLPLLATLVA